MVFLLGLDRRNGGHSRNNDRNGNNFGNNHNNSNGTRPTRFSNKRSRSRSPPPTRPSRFDNNSFGNDFKRARTDNSRPSNVSSHENFHSLENNLFKFRMNLFEVLILHQPTVSQCIH